MNNGAGRPSCLPEKRAGTLIRTAQSWKQARCPSLGEWLQTEIYPDNGKSLSGMSHLATERQTGALNSHFK